ncbi:MAG: hypothetical protein J7599_12260 [Niabella sp.]|nr:hypothetical protein [Niabella sp.]
MNGADPSCGGPYSRSITPGYAYAAKISTILPQPSGSLTRVDQEAGFSAVMYKGAAKRSLTAFQNIK